MKREKKAMGGGKGGPKIKLRGDVYTAKDSRKRHGGKGRI